MCLFRSLPLHLETFTAPAQHTVVNSAASLHAGKQHLVGAPSDKRFDGRGCMKERAGGVRAHSGRHRIGRTERSELGVADRLDASKSRAGAGDNRQGRLQPPARKTAASSRHAYRW